MTLKQFFLLGCLVCFCSSATRSATSELYEDPLALEDIAAEVGLRFFTRTWSGLVDDIDGNGYPDILVSRHAPVPSYLFYNNLGRFSLKEFGRPADRHDCASADVDLDGLVDIYCTTGAERGSGIGRNDLYIQRHKGKFQHMAKRYHVEDVFGRGRWTTFFDANGDEYPDLFVGNNPVRADSQKSTSKVFLNKEGISFIEAKGFQVGSLVNPYCLVVLDLDQNDLDDLIVCDRHNIRLFLNENGTHFRESVSQINGAKGVRALVGDLDSDGELDLVTLGRRKLELRLGTEGGNWGDVVYIKEFSNAQDISIADADGDGQLDIFVIEEGCNNGRPSDPTVGLNSRDDVLLLNRWPDFEPLHAPSFDDTNACGRQVLAIDSDLDKKSEFLILNGKGKSDGPLQLLRLKQDFSKPREQ